ncbi:MAG TPA: hypothetical protein VNN98_03320, partial [Rhizomicrobium sp.]|nr:hypothetical protein [Rhizomicrobium sp.]
MIGIFITTAASGAEKWGYELPSFGKDTRIVALYRSATGDIVAELSYGVGKTRYADFYDTGLKKRLAPDNALQIAQVYGVEKKIAADNHLTPIKWQMAVTNSAGTVFGTEDLSGPKCRWPYDVALTTMGAGPQDFQRDYLILKKLPKVERQSYGCNYLDSPGHPMLRTRYREQSPNLYWSSGPDVYFALRDAPYLVRFDAKGNTHFFDHRTDFVMVRAEKIGALVEKMET